ncbi:hypothetical protein PCASD_17230 [Puccinia coronata f. sp. avenae]|uniref:Uncharacterized protein n=1 Tax=Puccinia coronata f. sp. avenae TaxID=200324 RepID=A0A2N5T2W2_9BASI|nr:hypothetical protein PCASD_17230 [Puccinia coronata f. sp. avenae]
MSRLKLDESSWTEVVELPGYGCISMDNSAAATAFCAAGKHQAYVTMFDSNGHCHVLSCTKLRQRGDDPRTLGWADIRQGAQGSLSQQVARAC